MKSTVIALGIAVSTTSFPALGWADEHVALVEPAPPAPMFEVSLKAGGHFPQLTNELGTNLDALLKVGVGVALERRLQVFGELGYTQPTHKATVPGDARLGASGAGYTSTMTVRELNTSLGLAYFFAPLQDHLLPYAGAGLRLHFVKSTVEGGAPAAAFGKNEETSTQVGGQAFGGLGLRLGPGLALGELRFSYAGIGQKVTGDANIGSVSVLLGYGLLF